MSLFRRIIALATLTAAAALPAQSVAEHNALGDLEHDAFRPSTALKHYEAALAIDSVNAHALQKASLSAVDLGEGTTDKAVAASLFRLGEKYGRRAVAVAPDEAESYFNLARALGRAALNVGVRDRVKYAVDVRDQALSALKIDPNHPGALHVMGMWNAEVMRLNGFEKFFAKVINTKHQAGRARYIKRNKLVHVIRRRRRHVGFFPVDGIGKDLSIGGSACQYNP